MLKKYAVCENETAGAHRCSECQEYVHVSDDNEGFGANVTFQLCLRNNSINVEKECAK